MRRICIFLLALTVPLFVVITGFAASVPTADFSVKVIDLAGILTDEEESLIHAAAEDAISSIDMDFVILTTNDNLGKMPKQYSEEFYENNNYGIGPEYDGVMLYINMTDRDVYMTVSGRANAVLTLAVQDSVLDVVAEHLGSGDYSGACLAFITETERRISATPSEKIDKAYQDLSNRLDRAESSQNNGLTVLGAAGISVVIAGIALLILFLLHSRSLSPKPGIQTYFGGDGFKMVKSSDTFLRTHTSRTAIPRNNSGGSGGGTGGVSRSSGGRTFGGSGRKF